MRQSQDKDETVSGQRQGPRTETGPTLHAGVLHPPTSSAGPREQTLRGSNPHCCEGHPRASWYHTLNIPPPWSPKLVTPPQGWPGTPGVRQQQVDQCPARWQHPLVFPDSLTAVSPMHPTVNPALPSPGETQLTAGHIGVVALPVVGAQGPPGGSSEHLQRTVLATHTDWPARDQPGSESVGGTQPGVPARLPPA